MKETVEFILLAVIVAAMFGKLTKQRLPTGGFEIDFIFPVSENMNVKNVLLFLVFLLMFYLIKH